MNKIKAVLFFLAMAAISEAVAQSSTLTIKQQNEDFEIFKGGLQEGHSGIYYFINKAAFHQKCDSIKKTFIENSGIETYYLKLRYLITSLNHGHTRISLSTKGNINYKMAVLDSTKLYLPFEFLIVNKQLLIKSDCSNEQLFPKYSIVKSINNVSAKILLNKMLQFIPADGINKTFKYYNLYNYFYFNYLFNLFYPDKKGIKIEIENNNTHYYTKLLKPREIEQNYFYSNQKSISQYDPQLEYKPCLQNQTAYLKIGSFYKGLIERFGQKYESFLDSSFSDIKLKNYKNLILDLRNNEGGGDNYDFLLLSYLNSEPMQPDKVYVPGRKFNYLKHTIDVTTELKAYIDNPNEFLESDSTLILKEEYTGQVIYPLQKNHFNGKIIVLINGGTFSASTNLIKRLYTCRQSGKKDIVFIGEENGGDIYSNTECAGQGYTIKLPNSSIVVDMPLLCFGNLKKTYPKKRLPDYEVFNKIADLKNNRDAILEFALKKCRE